MKLFNTFTNQQERMDSWVLELNIFGLKKRPSLIFITQCVSAQEQENIYTVVKTFTYFITT